MGQSVEAQKTTNNSIVNCQSQIYFPNSHNEKSLMATPFHSRTQKSTQPLNINCDKQGAITLSKNNKFIGTHMPQHGMCTLNPSHKIIQMLPCGHPICFSNNMAVPFSSSPCYLCWKFVMNQGILTIDSGTHMCRPTE